MLTSARQKVDESGYNYKKGKSRSEKLNPDAENPSTTPKRTKITQEFRLGRISELKEKIKDLSDQLSYKEKRREAASNMHNYKDYDKLTEQMSALSSAAVCRRSLYSPLSPQPPSTPSQHSRHTTPFSVGDTPRDTSIEETPPRDSDVDSYPFIRQS